MTTCCICALSENPIPVHLFFLSGFRLLTVKFTRSVFSLNSQRAWYWQSSAADLQLRGYFHSPPQKSSAD